MMSAPHDKSFLRGSLTIRSPRSVLLMNPYQLPIVLCLFGVAVVFTFWPNLLEHSPVSFESRGLVHHAWHYALLASSSLTLVGMLSTRPWRLKAELIGLIGLVGAVGVNFVAMLADALGNSPEESSLNGLTLAVRFALILGFTVRAFIVATEPTVDLRETTTTLGG